MNLKYNEIINYLYNLNSELVKQNKVLKNDSIKEFPSFLEFKNVLLLKEKCLDICNIIQFHIFEDYIRETNEYKDFIEYFSNLLGYLTFFDYYCKIRSISNEKTK